MHLCFVLKSVVQFKRVKYTTSGHCFNRVVTPETMPSLMGT